jgi:hypothetical protein
MLTVWRKLTLEVDSMDTEQLESRAHDERQQGQISAIWTDEPTSGFSKVRLSPLANPPYLPRPDDFEGGALTIVTSGTELLVVRSTMQNPIEVTVVGLIPVDLIGADIIIRDDDPATTAQLPQTSVMNAPMSSAFQDAYIQIGESPPTWNLDNIVTWYDRLHWTVLNNQYLFGWGVGGSWNLDSQADFWTRRVVICYQAGPDENWDADPWENLGISTNAESLAQVPYAYQALPSLLYDASAVFGLTVAVLPFDALTTVYVETIRDNERDASSAKLWQYVSHEVGHDTVSSEGTRLGKATEHAEDGLMNNWIEDTPPFRRFTAPTLKRFRDVNTW